MTAALETYRPILVVVTFAFLGLAFYLTYRPRRTTTAANYGRSKMMTLNKVMLWAVTVVAVAFLFCPQYFSGLFASDGQFTANMNRTVLTVEGMTCPG